MGANLITELLGRGLRVRSFDRAQCTLPENPNLEIVTGDLCDPDTVKEAVAGIDTVFHTAAVIDIKSADETARKRSFAVNVDGTRGLVAAARAAGVKRFVYTASNSVVLDGRPIRGAGESLMYTKRFNDVYTETKTIAEQFVLEQNGVDGMLTCSIRPSGIWGPGDQTMFRQLFEHLLAGRVVVLVGGRQARLDNTFVHNLVHGYILAAEHLTPGGTAPGQAYFINDGEPVNFFEFARPIVEAVGQRLPKMRVSGRLVHTVMSIWHRLHSRHGIAPPPLEPGAVERMYLDNYFSIDKARRDLGYEPLFNTEQAIEQSLPYYRRLFNQIKGDIAQVK